MSEKHTEDAGALLTARRLLGEASGLIEDAITTHIYDEDNGDEIPSDCVYTATVAEIDAFLAGAEQPEVRVLVRVRGGQVEAIETDRPMSGLRVVVADFDTDGADPEELTDVNLGVEDWRWAHVSVHEPEHRRTLIWAEDFRDPDTEKLIDIFAPEMPRAMVDLLIRGAAGSDPVPLTTMFEAFDGEIAEREGWGLFDSDTYGFEIEADHDRPQFMRDGRYDDEAAVAFVRERAARGSIYHAYALAVHDRQREALGAK